NRSADVGHDHHVTRGGEYLRVPAIAPVLPPRALRSAVHQHQRRIFPGEAEIGWSHQESMHARLLRALHPELLELGQLMTVEQIVVQMGKRRGVAPSRGC